MTSDLRSRAARTGYAALVRPVLFRLGRGDAEAAHHATVRAAAALGRVPGGAGAVGALLGSRSASAAPVELLGLRFANRVGLAAGMDKDGVALAAWPALGFGHVELGTVTPRPQPGNPAPRLFRLPASTAVVNRMGFNNHGVEPLARRLRAARDRGVVPVPVGVSIGKNKATPVERAVDDYLTCVDALDGLADYLAVNVSSPNTPGLRTLQDAAPLGELLAATVARTRELATAASRGQAVPVLVKLAPDLTDEALDQALQVALAAGVRGIVATNTTLSREGVAAADRSVAQEAGGLSGAPLARRAREVVARIRRESDLPVIGVGGITTADDARAMVDAGADLVQLYTGLVYAGPALVTEAAAALRAHH